MTEQTPFRVEVADHTVAGRFTRPPSGKPPHSVVMFCRTPLEDDERDSVERLYDDLQAVFLDAGLAVLRYAPAEPTASDDETTANASTRQIDAAVSVARWAMLREDVDHRALGVLGYGPSAIIAVAAAVDVDRVGRLCLIDPATGMSQSVAQDAPAADHGANGAVRSETLEQRSSPGALASFDGDVMLLSAAADRTTPVDSAIACRRAVENAGRIVEHVLIARAEHGYHDHALRTVCVEQAARFFGQRVP